MENYDTNLCIYSVIIKQNFHNIMQKPVVKPYTLSFTNVSFYRPLKQQIKVTKPTCECVCMFNAEKGIHSCFPKQKRKEPKGQRWNRFGPNFPKINK